MPTGVVTFSYVQWIARYPEFAALSPTLAQLYFDEATLYLNNTVCSPVPDIVQRRPLLYMLTAHIAALNASGQPNSALVGRITSASQGSVSVSSSMEASQNSAWYLQTKYGAAYWQATKRFRGARWIPGVQPVFDPVLPFADPYRVP